VLSLLAAHRTVTTVATTPSDLAAAAASAGALKRANSQGVVFHDDFRLTPQGAVYTKLEALNDRRRLLAARKTVLEAAGAHPDHDSPGDSSTGAALVDNLLAAVDAFMGSLRAVPQGSNRSPLTIAALRDQLHDASGFTHVLLVKAEGASTQQVVDDRLFRDDRFSVVAFAPITYMLVATATSEILAAGTASGEAKGRGKIGGDFKFE
jgi:hypothetical protein